MKAPLQANAENPASEQVYRPQPFRLSLADDRRAVKELFRAQPEIRVYDTLLLQLRDLIRSRNPGRKLESTELDSLVAEYYGAQPVEDYGVWFYYPWSMRIVHLLDESEFVELRTNRNRYKITPEEQAELSRKRIGVVGLSVGQTVALTLALERSFGELRLADYDRLDLSNFNRLRAGVHSLNLPKVYITAREIAEMDPYLHVICFPNGVTETNCDAFLVGDSPLDIVVDECDSLDIKVLLRYRARTHRIPVVMDTSDRGMLDVERFDLEPERAIFHGLIGDIGPIGLRDLTTEQKIPYLLQIIGVDTLSTRLRASLIEVEQSISTWPQLGSSVTHGGAAAADVVRRICLGDLIRSGRYYIDLDVLVPSGADTICEQTEKVGAGRPPALQPGIMRSAVDRLAFQQIARGFAPSRNVICQLVGDAVLAPSGGNCQPWKWLSNSDQLYLFHDLSRSYTPFDPRGLGGLVALGASTENLVLSSHAAGLHIVSDLFPCKEIPSLIARFQFRSNADENAEPSWRDDLQQMIGIRRTNRKLCLRRPSDPNALDALTTAVHSIPGAELQWLLSEDELEECGELLGIGDRLLFLTESLNRFMVNEIRWTREEADATGDGVSLESLELSPADWAGFQLCRDWPALKMVRRLCGGKVLTKAGHKALASASAVGLITMPAKTAAAYFWGGRAVERLWLTAAERQVALHPMSALSYMLTNLHPQDQCSFDAETQETLNGLYPRYAKLFSISDPKASVFLFRLSSADETSRRSSRRHLDDVLEII